MKDYLFKYTGRKSFFSEQFNEMIAPLKEKIYIESFLGSGAIFSNLKKEFELYIINDFSSEIISIWNAIKQFNYEEFFDFKKFIIDKFGDIKENKESY